MKEEVEDGGVELGKVERAGGREIAPHGMGGQFAEAQDVAVDFRLGFQPFQRGEPFGGRDLPVGELEGAGHEEGP